MEDRNDLENQKHQNEIQKTPFVVRIPSYEEVVEASQPKPQSSFSQAFNFIKNSEFYTTPPQPSKGSPSPSHGTHPRSFLSISLYSSLKSDFSIGLWLDQGLLLLCYRQFVQPEAPSTSVSSTGANRNAILVSNRQVNYWILVPLCWVQCLYSNTLVTVMFRAWLDVKFVPWMWKWGVRLFI